MAGERRALTCRDAVATVVVAVVVAAALVPCTARAAAAAAAVDRGTGIGTAAALASPTCDAHTGKVAVPTSLVPPCVSPLPRGESNGGATTAGVTATSIRVVAVLPNAEQEAAFRTRGQALPFDAATGRPGTWEDAVHDMAAPYERFFEQWRRSVEYVFYTSTGSDEAAQHADAIAIAALHPFAALAIPGGIVLQRELANKRIVVLGTPTNVEGRRQAPYRWGAFAVDTAAAEVNAGEFVAKSLVGRPAVWAGDSAMRDRTRSVAVLYPAPESRLDFKLEYFDDAFARAAPRRTRTPVAVPYTSPTTLTSATAEAQEQAPQLVARLKESGATTVVLFAVTDVVREVLARASAQDYRPEWVITSYALLDVNILARTVDQEQWSHAFGLGGQLPPVVHGASGPNFGLYGWYWGQDDGTITPLLQGYMAFLYVGIHMAGPDLTPAHYRTGMFAMPPTGGAAADKVNSYEQAFGPRARLPYDEYLAIGLDAALVWWSPTTPLPANATGATAFAGTGTYLYVNGAQRYQAGSFPKGLPAFFDASASIAAVDPLPAADVQPDYPCTGCPSEA
ncbi:MAG: hypothetical protein ACHQIG_11475 [Acidimicrobiia bacterium]